MTTSTHSTSVNIPEQADPIAVRRQAAIFLIIEFLLIFAPLIILGAAINWPASLDEPAAYPGAVHGDDVRLFYLPCLFPAVLADGIPDRARDRHRRYREYTFPCGQRVCRPFCPGAGIGACAMAVCYAGAGTPIH